MGVTGRIFTLKNSKDSMGKRYSYSTIWEQHIEVFLNIYGATVIFLLFYDHQDTESKSGEI